MKHFLDTSVVRSLFSGTSAYREHLRSEIGLGRKYISNYIEMEFRRGFLVHLMEFYAWLELPTNRTYGEALRSWSHQWGGRLKAVMQLAGDLCDVQGLDPDDPSDKGKALLAIGRMIRRYELKLKGCFRNTGSDRTQCARATVKLSARLASLSEDLTAFQQRFNDKESCRKACRIDDVLLDRYRTEVARYVELAAAETDPGAKQFKKIAEHLDGLLQKGPAACTCYRCGQVGDAVIALESPRNCRLEHTDTSFDYLCSSIGQDHKRHGHERAFFKESESGTE
ncbi:MAG: hypothetical protein WBP34_02655 [Thermoanaerobaculia bacterium]